MSNIITKADVRKLLKDKFQYGYIKYQVAKYPIAKYHKLADNVKGIILYCSSPLDCTSAKYDKGNVVLKEVIGAFLDLGAQVSYIDGYTVKMNPGTKQEFEFSLDKTSCPSYSSHLNMDPGYRNHYVVVNFLEKK